MSSVATRGPRSGGRTRRRRRSGAAHPARASDTAGATDAAIARGAHEQSAFTADATAAARSTGETVAALLSCQPRNPGRACAAGATSAPVSTVAR
nr:hypothetical protein [Mycobacterium gordonae]